MPEAIKIGDHIEVFYFVYDEAKSVAVRTSRRAKCCRDQDEYGNIGAVFDDGTQVMLRRQQWRPA